MLLYKQKDNVTVIILEECKEAIVKTKNEIEEFKLKYPDIKDFLENLTLCWEEKL